MVIIDGNPYPSGAKELHLLNRSWRYGDGLFETMRVYHGKILFLPDHLQRLFRGMELLEFVFDAGAFRHALQEALQRLLQEGGFAGQHGRIRLQVYRKGEGAYLPLDNHPGFVAEGFLLKEDPYRDFSPLFLEEERGFGLPGPPLSNVKTANALPYVLAAIRARKAGADDAILFRGKYATETTRSNLFVVRKKRIFTPPLSQGCLDGVMRKQIFRLCQELRIPLREKGLTGRDLRRADELFVTNTIRGIEPVARWKTYSYAVDQFPLTNFLQQSLLRWVDNL